MAFVREKAYENAIQKVRIEFGDLVGMKDKAEAYVVLKELPTLEMMQMNEAHEKGQRELIEFFRTVLPRIITEHNLYETDDKKMTAGQITEFIFEKLDLTSRIISEYAQASFFTPRSRGEGK